MAVTRKAESVREYSSPCIDMRHGNALISTDSDIGGSAAVPVSALGSSGSAWRQAVTMLTRWGLEWPLCELDMCTDPDRLACAQVPGLEGRVATVPVQPARARRTLSCAVAVMRRWGCR
jgi:hypothetical protein